MKFSDGYWNLRKGVTLHSPAEARDISAEQKLLKITAPTKKIHHRGDTLNLAQLTFEFSSPIPDCIGVKIFHHKGRVDHGPAFQLYENPDTPVEILFTEYQAMLVSGDLSVQIKRNSPWQIDYFYREKRLTGSKGKSSGYLDVNGSGCYMREQLDLNVGECVYGLGERFTPFVKNGQSVDIWNEDGGTCSEQAYKNIPFYLTNRGYGVFVNHPECVSFEVASENVNKVQFSVPGESLEYFIIGGSSPKEVLAKYTSLTGKPALPPSWSFGLWLTTSFTTSYDEATVTQFIGGMIERDIPLQVFHFDCFWMKEFQWCDFKWDHDVFPDPSAMLQRLKEKGLKICVWINPYIAQKSYLFDEGMEKGYLVKTPDGNVWQWDNWQSGMGLVDFTNPDAVAWYRSKLKELLDMGVDCFKTDFGERIPTDVAYDDGSDPFKMHNYYTYLYNKTVFDLLREECGENEAVLFARSATCGGQQFPVHWGGDCTANYTSMAESLRGGLSLCLSGFAFWSHDIGGFERTATPDLYKRWIAFGLLSTHSRLHGNETYRVPWLFDEESVEVLRFFTKLKCRLMPYIYAAACAASTEGIPVMRAMFLEFPDDPCCDYLDRQYMLAESILVAPIFSEDKSVQYYVPEGTWTNFITGERIYGGRWRKETHDYFSLPMLIRQNSLIAIGDRDHNTDYDYANDVTLQLFDLQDGHECMSVVYNTKGQTELKVTITRNGNTMEVQAIGSGKPWKLLLRGIIDVQDASSFDIRSVPEGTLITPKPGTEQSFTILTG